jgi:hypothetical protein
VVEALATAFQDLDRWEEHTDTLTKVLKNYLSEEHRDAPGTGCALGALLGNMPRASRSAKAVYTAVSSALWHTRRAWLPRMATLIGAPVGFSRLVQCQERPTSLVPCQTRVFHERFSNGLAMS